MSERFISDLQKGQELGMLSKTEELLARYDDIIDLSVGDPDMTTPAPIIEASYRDSLAGHTHYTAFRGDPELRAEVVNFYKEEYDVDIADENVFVVTSANLAMFVALFATLDPGDEVLYPDPCFPVYTEQIRMCRGKAVAVPTYEEERFRFNPQRAREYVTDRTKALIINSPNNPTGACMTVADMQEIAACAEEFDLLVIADDIYTSMSYETPFVPFMSLPGMQDRTITINSASKNFVMTGYRIGWMVASAALTDALRKANDVMVFTAPAPSQRAALFALKHRHEVMPPVLEEFRRRVFKTAELIQSIPKLSVRPPTGTFYLFVNIKETGLTSEEFAYKVLEDAHVLMLSGTAFGAAGEGYVRIACTRSVEDLTEAMERIRRIDF